MSWADVSWEQAFWTILTGSTCGVACAVLGCFLVLRRMSMLGDAISHGVLPGIAIAYLLTGEITGLPIVLGAMFLGALTAFLAQSIHSYFRVPADASIGVVFTGLFAIGVIIIVRAAHHSHIDADCVLYGLIEYVPADQVRVFGYWIPRALRTLIPVLLLTLAFLGVLWKELKLVSFDPALATAMGFSATLVHYLLMGMVAGVTVASFEAVGAILVVAMLVAPAATAQLLTDRLSVMVLCAAVVAVVSSLFGYFGALWLDTSVAGMMAVAAGAQFGLAVIFAPRHGVLSRQVRNWRLALRIVCEDIVGSLYRAEESGLTPTAAWDQAARATASRHVRGWTRWLAPPLLRWQGIVEETDDGGFALTPAGRQLGKSLVRAHRLWEAYLGAHLDLPLDHLHEPAHRMEHFIGPELQDQLAKELVDATVDPHGRAIPPRSKPDDEASPK